MKHVRQHQDFEEIFLSETHHTTPQFEIQTLLAILGYLLFVVDRLDPSKRCRLQKLKLDPGQASAMIQAAGSLLCVFQEKVRASVYTTLWN